MKGSDESFISVHEDISVITDDEVPFAFPEKLSGRKALSFLWESSIKKVHMWVKIRRTEPSSGDNEKK